MTAKTETKPNGATAEDEPETTFPLDSFKDASRHLRRPFTAAAVKFKVQATWPKDNPSGGLIVAYIDARLAVERLNLLVPHLWHDAYRPVGNGQMWCDLTVDGITRSDVGEGQGKGLVSDALKRAAVKFGIGVSLYAIPKMILETKDGCLKQKNLGGKKTLVIEPKGEKVLRLSYEQWLRHHGVQAFGEALDHGDVVDAQGDHEADGEEREAPAGVDPETGEVVGLPDEVIAEMEAALRDLKAKGIWDGSKIKGELVAAGARDTSSVGVALRTLAPCEDVDKLRSTMADLLIADPDDRGRS